MENKKIVPVLVLSLSLIACSLKEEAPQQKMERTQEIECSLDEYGEVKNELRLIKGLYPITDDYVVGESEDGSLRHFSNPIYDEDSEARQNMHASKRIDCFEGKVTEEDVYFGRFGYLSMNSDGREYEPDTTYENMRVIYDYSNDELDITVYSSNDPENIDGAYINYFSTVEELDSVLSAWKINRK